MWLYKLKFVRSRFLLLLARTLFFISFTCILYSWVGILVQIFKSEHVIPEDLLLIIIYAEVACLISIFVLKKWGNKFEKS